MTEGCWRGREVVRFITSALMDEMSWKLEKRNVTEKARTKTEETKNRILCLHCSFYYGNNICQESQVAIPREKKLQSRGGVRKKK